MMPPAQPTAANAASLSFEFRGAGAEYFKIWSVNILLSVLTLGIYSAWAKVRNKRYFYGNTFLCGANFDYHASPVGILLARIVLLAALVGAGVLAAYVLEEWTPEAVDALLNSLVLFIFLPWALSRGLAFNARNSSYRAVRLQFEKNAWPLWGGFVAAAILPILSWPFLLRAYHRYKASRHYYGAVKFEFNAPLSPYLAALWLYPLLAVAAANLAVVGIGFAGGQGAFSDGEAAEAALLAALILVGALAVTLIPAILLKTFWNYISFNGGRLRCNFSPIKFVGWIVLPNLFLTVVTLGLYRPWAQVRRAKYLAAHIKAEMTAAALDDIVSAGAEKQGALGEELVDLEGVGFDIALV